MIDGVFTMNLYGKQWSRREIETYFGRLEQVGGLQRFHLQEGPEAGVEQILVRTGSGLTYYVTPSKCLDIYLTEFCGVPVSWQSPNGNPNPAFFDPRETEWMRTASGGLLMTCGLTQVGSPCQDGTEKLGLHGRAHHLPARQVVAEGIWQNDQYKMSIRGYVEETSIDGHRLRLSREIQSFLGNNSIRICDTIENIGFKPAPHMILYHFNFGYPLIDENVILHFPSRRVVPQNREVTLDHYEVFQKPDTISQEQVYYHEDLIKNVNLPDRETWTSITLRAPFFPLVPASRSIPLNVILSWDSVHLNKFIQWKMTSAGCYVLGLEPANCYVEGRVAERNNGTLVSLEPGESRRYNLELNFQISA